jgi:transcriptional regulator of NAD metabolism
MRDCNSKGRNALGTMLPAAKLTEKDAEDIKIKYGNGITTTQLVKEYGVVAEIIIGILRGKRWPHVRPDIKYVTRSRSKLTDDQVIEIRSGAVGCRHGYRSLMAKKFGVSAVLVSYIISGKSHKKIP